MAATRMRSEEARSAGRAEQCVCVRERERERRGAKGERSNVWGGVGVTVPWL